MSSNQRPTGVRIISSQSNSPNAGRRRGDAPAGGAGPDTGDQADAVAQRRAKAEQEALAAAEKAKGGMGVMVLMFLIGCALGGAGLAYLGLGGQP